MRLLMDDWQFHKGEIMNDKGICTVQILAGIVIAAVVITLAVVLFIRLK